MENIKISIEEIKDRLKPLFQDEDLQHLLIFGSLAYEKAPGVFHEFCSLAFRRYVNTKKLREARAKSISYFLDAKGLS